MDHLYQRRILPLRLAALAVAVWLIHPYIHPLGNHSRPTRDDHGEHTDGGMPCPAHDCQRHHEDKGETPDCNHHCDLCAARSEKAAFVLPPQGLTDWLARPLITDNFRTQPSFSGRLDWPESHSHRGPPFLS